MPNTLNNAAHLVSDLLRIEAGEVHNHKMSVVGADKEERRETKVMLQDAEERETVIYVTNGWVTIPVLVVGFFTSGAYWKIKFKRV